MSVYVYLKYNTTYYACRLSDHSTFRSIRNIRITKNTKRDNVVAFLENTIKMLKDRSLKNALSTIEINDYREQFNNLVNDTEADIDYDLDQKGYDIMKKKTQEVINEVKEIKEETQKPEKKLTKAEELLKKINNK